MAAADYYALEPEPTGRTLPGRFPESMYEDTAFSPALKRGVP